MSERFFKFLDKKTRPTPKEENFGSEIDAIFDRYTESGWHDSSFQELERQKLKKYYLALFERDKIKRAQKAHDISKEYLEHVDDSEIVDPDLAFPFLEKKMMSQLFDVMIWTREIDFFDTYAELLLRRANELNLFGDKYFMEDLFHLMGHIDAGVKNELWGLKPKTPLRYLRLFLMHRSFKRLIPAVKASLDSLRLFDKMTGGGRSNAYVEDNGLKRRDRTTEAPQMNDQ